MFWSTLVGRWHFSLSCVPCSGGGFFSPVMRCHVPCIGHYALSYVFSLNLLLFHLVGDVMLCLICAGCSSLLALVLLMLVSYSCAFVDTLLLSICGVHVGCLPLGLDSMPGFRDIVANSLVVLLHFVVLCFSLALTLCLVSYFLFYWFRPDGRCEVCR